MNSELKLQMSSEVVSVKSEMVSEMVANMVLELEMEKGSGLPSESKLIGHICFKDIHDV